MNAKITVASTLPSSVSQTRAGQDWLKPVKAGTVLKLRFAADYEHVKEQLPPGSRLTINEKEVEVLGITENPQSKVVCIEVLVVTNFFFLGWAIAGVASIAGLSILTYLGGEAAEKSEGAIEETGKTIEKATFGIGTLIIIGLVAWVLYKRVSD